MSFLKKNKVEYVFMDKLRAAYALNLCTVSVSQIVDYGDIQILEQEYETILNNLKLENMPKDEALLNIIRQLFDIIASFRIQEDDKKFIEKEYQQKMKNAIWSAIPDFGLIIAEGNPMTMAISVASQVGIGYMNYRKTKAENNLEFERQKWQLPRTAIERFNGLRRELFDISWRLAEKYEFPDEYRLTEKQIEQYNEILMERDILRKYDRLSAIKDYFKAYPPFWYYYGHAANEIAQKAKMDGKNSIYDKFSKCAVEHFRYFRQVNKYSLLREDCIACSCALECAELLDIENDKDEIYDLINLAQKQSGRECDILQLCAISYIRIGKIEFAIPLLKYLINERYNDVMNAQLLSYILVSYVSKNNKDRESKIQEYKEEYDLLCEKIQPQLLFPMPQRNYEIYHLKEHFIENQKMDLREKYAYVLRNYYVICSIKFNKALPCPFRNKVYSDEFYSIYQNNERVNEYKAVFKDKNITQDFLFRLNDSNFTLVYLDVLNEMINSYADILPFLENDKIQIIEELIMPIKEEIGKNKEILNNHQILLNGNNQVNEMQKILDVSFEMLTGKFLNMLYKIIGNHIETLQEMKDFAKEESMLMKFCVNNNIPEFHIDNYDNNYYEKDNEQKVYFASDMIGKSI